MMKNKTRTLTNMLFLLLTITVTGCTGLPKQSVDDKIATDISPNALEEVKETPPEEIKSIRFEFLTEGGASGKEITDKEIIEEIHRLICKMSLGQATQMAAEDNGLNLEIVTEKQTFLFCFEQNIWVFDTKARFEVDQLAPLKGYLEELLKE